MTSIIAYQKFTDATRTVELKLPENEQHQRIGTELCTINGITYVSLPDDAALPEQPEEIFASVVAVVLDDALRAEIKASSPHCWLINDRVVEQIRAKYSQDDEIKLLRLAPSAETDEWNAYVETCRQWGRDERAKLGL